MWRDPGHPLSIMLSPPVCGLAAGIAERVLYHDTMAQCKEIGIGVAIITLIAAMLFRWGWLISTVIVAAGVILFRGQLVTVL
jgi:hypothetical protein